MNVIKGLVYNPAPLIEAIKEYDRTAPERQKLWDNIESNQDVRDAEKADLEALERVQAAFWKVTRDRNSLESCLRIDIDFARQIANLGRQQLQEI